MGKSRKISGNKKREKRKRKDTTVGQGTREWLSRLFTRKNTPVLSPQIDKPSATPALQTSELRSPQRSTPSTYVTSPSSSSRSWNFPLTKEPWTFFGSKKTSEESGPKIESHSNIGARPFQHIQKKPLQPYGPVNLQPPPADYLTNPDLTCMEDTEYRWFLRKKKQCGKRFFRWLDKDCRLVSQIENTNKNQECLYDEHNLRPLYDNLCVPHHLLNHFNECQSNNRDEICKIFQGINRGYVMPCEEREKGIEFVRSLVRETIEKMKREKPGYFNGLVKSNPALLAFNIYNIILWEVKVRREIDGSYHFTRSDDFNEMVHKFEWYLSDASIIKIKQYIMDQLKQHTKKKRNTQGVKTSTNLRI
jgi:hypothetical protein